MLHEVQIPFFSRPYKQFEVKVARFRNDQAKTQSEETLPNVLSLVFHPLWMPMLGILFILFWSGMYITLLPIEAKRIILLIVGLCMIGLPVALLLFYRMYHWINSFYMSRRRERILPLICIAIFYYIAYRTLHNMHTPFIIQKFILASTVAVFLASFISIFWKISLHGVGIGGVTGMVAALTTVSPMLLPVLSAFIILSGLVGYARIRLNAHTPAQYYTGVLLGFGLMFEMFFII
ncbi:MAG: hypothetical protein LBL04_12725 [Bacteroidales bacterium]|jgi:hypothetical protein|nr:hypothetical protein [Bacteroidales bacterium]